MKWQFPIAAAAVLAAWPHAAAAAPKQARPAEIVFANHGGIEDWRAVGDRTIYFEDGFRHWYKAVLMSPAPDLPYVERIAVDTGPTGSLDSFGAVIVRGRNYPFASFEAVPGPPPSGKRHPGHMTPRAKPNT